MAGAVFMSTRPGRGSSGTRVLDFDQVWSSFSNSSETVEVEENVQVPTGRTLELMGLTHIDLNGKSVTSTGGTITTTAGSTNLDSAVAQKGSVKLIWNGGSGSIGHYLIRYGTSPGSYTNHIVMPKTPTNAVISGLTNNTRYYFTVNGSVERSNTPHSCRSDYDNDGGNIDFFDFFIWADHYGETVTSDALQRFDLSGNAVIDSTSDLVPYFLADFNKSCSAIPKLAARPAGQNRDGELTTKIDVTQNRLSFDVEVSGVSSMRGYGLVINYDPTRLAFTGFSQANGLLEERGAGAVVGLERQRPGRVMIAAALKPEHTGLVGRGPLTQAQFHILKDFGETAPITLDHLVLIDDERKTNELIVDAEAVAQPVGATVLRTSPNPFNPITSIEVSLDSPSEVELHLYDSLGQKVRTLVDRESRPAGRHVFEWDGRNEAGHAVATGTYFIRLRTHGETYHKRVTLLR